MKCLLAGLAFCVLLPGCGKGDESLAKKSGKGVGRALTDFATGVGSGVDEKMTVEVELGKEAQAAGLSKTTAKALGLDSLKKGFTVYFISIGRTEGTLMAKALNKDNQEIGRSKVEVSFDKDEAKYVTFTFDGEMDSALVVKYLVDLVRAAPPPGIPADAEKPKR